MVDGDWLGGGAQQRSSGGGAVVVAGGEGLWDVVKGIGL